MSRWLILDPYYIEDLKRRKSFGNDLLSQESALQVPSALTGLTTGFEM